MPAVLIGIIVLALGPFGLAAGLATLYAGVRGLGEMTVRSRMLFNISFVVAMALLTATALVLGILLGVLVLLALPFWALTAARDALRRQRLRRAWRAGNLRLLTPSVRSRGDHV